VIKTLSHHPDNFRDGGQSSGKLTL